MPPSNVSPGKRPRASSNFRPRSTQGTAGSRPAAHVTGSASQKQAQWLARADEAVRAGDGVEAERCRQYAEHWYRVSRGQE
ncbi:DUF4167 domain-containing protein [Azospirillum sp. OGB3]|uniref:DUF4167 domain-containing protein n=1 Tax=Azospirillum sp. OGB3 TaxID=2587012 RepID=UPI0016058AF9|nr:DUF4167 domain-containing protein [Azospirillum sp. OGB3]